jgi:hypothetical protein
MLEYTSLGIPERCKNDSLRQVEKEGGVKSVPMCPSRSSG